MDSLEIVVCGLSITSTRHNTHAGTWRNLLRAMAGRGHRITFLERDQTRFEGHRDLTSTPYCEIHLYRDLEELRDRFGGAVARADMVMVGSGVPQGAAVSQWVLDTSRGIRAFYDLDAPGATEEILAGNSPWLAPERIRDFDLFLTSTGGLLLGQAERKLGVRLARPLYPSADPVEHVRPAVATQYDLGHLAPYCSRRFRSVTELLLESAQGWEGGRFVLAGPEYPPATGANDACSGTNDAFDHRCRFGGKTHRRCGVRSFNTKEQNHGIRPEEASGRTDREGH